MLFFSTCLNSEFREKKETQNQHHLYFAQSMFLFLRFIVQFLVNGSLIWIVFIFSISFPLFFYGVVFPYVKLI